MQCIPHILLFSSHAIKQTTTVFGVFFTFFSTFSTFEEGTSLLYLHSYTCMESCLRHIKVIIMIQITNAECVSKNIKVIYITNTFFREFEHKFTNNMNFTMFMTCKIVWAFSLIFEEVINTMYYNSTFATFFFFFKELYRVQQLRHGMPGPLGSRFRAGVF